MLDPDLTSPGHSSSKQMPPNERPTYLYIWANSGSTGQNLFIFRVRIDKRLGYAGFKFHVSNSKTEARRASRSRPICTGITPTAGEPLNIHVHWAVKGPAIGQCFSPSRRYKKTVSFSMIKDVLHIMFTLVTKRKDSSFWSYTFYCEWFESLRV